jgi:hypothetical protein
MEIGELRRCILEVRQNKFVKGGYSGMGTEIEITDLVVHQHTRALAVAIAHESAREGVRVIPLGLEADRATGLYGRYVSLGNCGRWKRVRCAKSNLRQHRPCCIPQSHGLESKCESASRLLSRYAGRHPPCCALDAREATSQSGSCLAGMHRRLAFISENTRKHCVYEMYHLWQPDRST